ncbi:YceD family protein [Kordiimonas lacus]|uniref:Uncharacterized ACR, COG1399 n=1 Tax=Kordiimonas lacus TaxID=637679 RepID=A0A1G6W792_9PROT|nr:YceD family protein [Kordiimonas lacus]SDD61087.1 Uncharacterized ACR, COG1399 [Kordiimonas lacus]
MTDQLSLDFTVKITELERTPKEFKLVATEAQCKDLAERFDLVAVAELSGTLSVWDAGADSGIHIKGSIAAKLTQRCIASLKPVEESFETDFELMLVNPEMADRMDDEGVYLDPEAPDYDALEGDVVPLGEVLAQTLSISMNPYPRAEGVELETKKMTGVSINEPELERPNPFAVLAKSRDES